MKVKLKDEDADEYEYVVDYLKSGSGKREKAYEGKVDDRRKYEGKVDDSNIDDYP